MEAAHTGRQVMVAGQANVVSTKLPKSPRTNVAESEETRKRTGRAEEQLLITVRMQSFKR